jgi:hypothetical protein
LPISLSGSPLAGVVDFSFPQLWPKMSLYCDDNVGSDGVDWNFVFLSRCRQLEAFYHTWEYIACYERRELPPQPQPLTKELDSLQWIDAFRTWRCEVRSRAFSDFGK